VELFPAIDIRNGRVVRLSQGETQRETVYRDDPPEQAEEFVRLGATWVHVVDLDRAFGTGDNARVIGEIAKRVGTRVRLQLGGGLRSMAAIEAALGLGIARAVLGTAAIDDPSLVRQAISCFGADRVAAGIDTRDGLVATRGWAHTTSVSAGEACRRLLGEGIRTMIYTDVARDGMLTGPDLAGAARLARFGASVIASGGVASLSDIRQVAETGLAGVIVGRALYEGRFTLTEALVASAS